MLPKVRHCRTPQKERRGERRAYKPISLDSRGGHTSRGCTVREGCYKGVCRYDDAQVCAHITLATLARSPHGAYMLSVLIVPLPCHC